MKNKYKALLSNTALFFISTFSSKFLTFLLMPIYTAVLLPEEYNVVDLVTKAANLLIPIVSLGIPSGIIRFGLDENYSKRGVFTVSAITYMIGYVILLACYPVISKVTYISRYMGYLYLYLFCSCLRTLVQQFTRARAYTKLYAIDGILATVSTLFFVYLYLVKLRMGAMGYVLAIITSDFLSFLFLSVISGALKYFKLSSAKPELFREMWRFCLPLIPTGIFWWITNASDVYLVRYFVSAAVSGIYGISYKIPSIVNLFSTVFTEAWQISAVQEGQKENANDFFKTVFKAYQSIIFMGGAGLILMCRILVDIMTTGKAYYESWRFVPVLIMATVFSCFSSFLSSIYMVQKNGTANLLTMMAGALSNIAMNLYLIPRYGAQGAAVATFISYLLVFVLRALGTRRFISVDVSPLFMTCNVIMMGALSAVMVFEITHWIPIAIALTAVIVLVNFRPLFMFMLPVIRKILGRNKAKA
ncbi:MAG: polysaccharide biosynthesis protein [Oscillospiraceae bacterium]|nr:polysaccharide biosynthesis protein [Oscillospiraceae bacterium]